MDLFPITRYEKVRLLGTRACQLAHGAEPKTDIKGLTDPLKIAEKEYKEGVIPLNIIRTLPSGEQIEITIRPIPKN